MFLLLLDTGDLTHPSNLFLKKMLGMAISERIERHTNSLVTLETKINGTILYACDSLGFIKCFSVCIFTKSYSPILQKRTARLREVTPDMNPQSSYGSLT